MSLNRQKAIANPQSETAGVVRQLLQGNAAAWVTIVTLSTQMYAMEDRMKVAEEKAKLCKQKLSDAGIIFPAAMIDKEAEDAYFGPLQQPQRT